MATGGSDGSLPARRAKILPSRSTSTLQPAAAAQSTNRSRICLSSADRASRRRPTSRNRPIAADFSRLSHNRSGLTSRTLVTTCAILLLAAFSRRGQYTHHRFNIARSPSRREQGYRILRLPVVSTEGRRPERRDLFSTISRLSWRKGLSAPRFALRSRRRGVAICDSPAGARAAL